MKRALLLTVVMALIAAPAQAKIMTTRVVGGQGALEWNVRHHYDRDAQVFVTVYMDGRDIPGKQISDRTSTYTRGKRTVTVIARDTRFTIRAVNFARAPIRVTVKLEPIP